MIAGCGGGSSNPTELEKFFYLLFDLNHPSFAALENNGEWQQLDLNGDFEQKINLTDPDGRFKLAIICPFRGVMRGYLYQDTTNEISQINFNCDNTDETGNYEFNGNVSMSFSNRVAVGTNFRDNYRFIDSNTSAIYSFDRDAPTKGDILVEAFGFNAKHRKLFRNVDYFSAAPVIYDNPQPSDVGDSYPYDATKPATSPGFVGVGVKFNADNLKAVLDEFTSGETTGTYNTVPGASANTDFYTNYAWSEEQVISSGVTINFRNKISYVNSQPPLSLTYEHLPLTFAPEDVKFEENDDGFPIVGVNASYDADVFGMSAKLVRARYENINIDWSLYSTVGHSSSIEFPGKALANLAGYDTDYDIAPFDFKDLTQYQSNGSVEQLDRYLMSGHIPEAEDDGFIYSYTRIF